MLLSAGDEVAGVVSDSPVLCKNKGFVPCCGQEEKVWLEEREDGAFYKDRGVDGGVWLK